mmetsp:Transcript_2988/g.3129  ORF Transcript_2988/g.3129 Transcript_2988/m.3129 type:complete len:449 (+) Transcript_2988:231-1577(+)
MQAVSLVLCSFVLIVNSFTHYIPKIQKTQLLSTVTAIGGVEIARDYLNSPAAKTLVKKIVLLDQKLFEEAEKANFWSGQSFVVKDCECTDILKEGLVFDVKCDVKGKIQSRKVNVPFPKDTPIVDENALKNFLVSIAGDNGRIKDTPDICRLGFGQDCSMPLDLLFNAVPHPAWVRSYMYEQVTTAVRLAVNDETMPNRSRMQVKVNFPEVNPAFDTYRVGTILEMVRQIVLTLTIQEGKRVRVCIQQSMGLGIFTGLPMSLSGMRQILEGMDWGTTLTTEERAQQGDVKNPRKEALIRFGCIGADQVAEDDDVVIIIAPQNTVNGELVTLLDDMCKSAKGRPIILINPKLGDQPSANDVMQIRGRAERKIIENSFQDIFTVRLLYPSNGGYMYPIRGMVVKKSYHSMWVAYLHSDKKSPDEYSIIGAFPPNPSPSPAMISDLFTNRK